MTTHQPAPRPFSVTFVVLITWAIAIMSFLAGLIFLVADAQTLIDAGMTKSTANSYGLFEVCFGLVAALVAVGLGNGNNLSRFLVTALMIARLMASGYAAWLLFGQPQFWFAVGVMLLALVVIFLLFNDKADRFFATN